MEELFEAAGEKYAVDDQDREQEHKFRRRHDEKAAHSVMEDMRHRQPDHVPHRHIHQKHQKHERHDEPPLHVFHCLFLRRAAALCRARLRQLRAIALVRHRVDDRLRNIRAVILYVQPPRQQIDIRLCDARHTARHALHTRAARRARHARDGELLLHTDRLVFFYPPF